MSSKFFGWTASVVEALNDALHPWQQTSLPNNSTGICKVRPHVGQTLAKRTELDIVFTPREEFIRQTLLRSNTLCQSIKATYTPKMDFLTSSFLNFPRSLHRFTTKTVCWDTGEQIEATTVPKWSEIVLVKIARDRQGLGNFSGELAAERLRELLKNQHRARLVVATGSSQFEVLEVLSKAEGIDWSRVDGFHLDEYLGLDRTHPASFCGYLASRFVDLVPIGSFHFLDGKKAPEEVLREASRLWRYAPIDLAMIGIGENSHLAFNDPPADFETREIYHVVTLDEACRKQQVGEGWFPDLEACPSQAISMTIHGILQSKQIICSVPDERKAAAVAASLEGPLSPNVPASILRQHENVTLGLDDASASKLSSSTLAAAY